MDFLGERFRSSDARDFGVRVLGRAGRAGRWGGEGGGNGLADFGSSGIEGIKLGGGLGEAFDHGTVGGVVGGTDR